MDEWWKNDPDDPDSRDERERQRRADQATIFEFIETAMRRYPRQRLLELKNLYPDCSFLHQLIDDHLANRFWKGCDVPEEEESDPK